jgi:hypothetical protein
MRDELTPQSDHVKFHEIQPIVGMFYERLKATNLGSVCEGRVSRKGHMKRQ